MAVFIYGDRHCFVRSKLLKNDIGMFDSKKRADKRGLSKLFGSSEILNDCFRT